MSHQGETQTPTGGTDDAFASALHSLKQDGCALLVVGTPPDFAFESVCQQMLGDPTYSTRRRLVVATDKDVTDACTRLQTIASQDSATAKVLSFRSEARTATTQSPSQPAQPHVPVEHVPGSSLSELGIAVSEAIAEFEADASLDPAELRVCVDSLTPLVDRDREQLFQFLDLLNERIRRASGMGHMHLPINRESELVHLLEPVFDAVIELRVQDNTPQQRWYLPDEDLQSGWIVRE